MRRPSTRLPRGLYDEGMRRIEGRIEKKDTWYRKSLPHGLKLSITLRHQAYGDNYPSLFYNFRVTPNTIFLIIYEVCDAIKAEFAAESIQFPTIPEEWTAITENALDGKHVAVTCPWNTGSVYINFKAIFSIVFMALVDSDYKFHQRCKYLQSIRAEGRFGESE
ncbi:hypothetical protein MAR_025778 [Mya arenaria]|uniref:Uncharacterized protein n=1 Tax=Mya arenaria TaxID=6604 RepID=A0ABY7ENP0_MYAAR|nr:hypothetical protein MAR_025778 [Mya arenaria]